MKVTTEALRTFFVEQFPQAPVIIEESREGYCRVRLKVGDEHLRPGSTVAGPVMVWIVDCATYGAVLTEIGLVPLAVTTSMNINFLRKPDAESALIGEAQILKRGRRLVVAEARVMSAGKEELVAHATLTYSIPPRDEAV